MQHLLYSSKSSEVLEYAIRHYFIIYIKFYFEKKEKKRWHSCFSGSRYLIIQIMTVCSEELVLAGTPTIVQRLALPGPGIAYCSMLRYFSCSFAYHCLMSAEKMEETRPCYAVLL
jgi:hypothetical protein